MAFANFLLRRPKTYEGVAIIMMKFIVTMNQIGYFKPETTARRLKAYYYSRAGDPVVFLGYLRLIRLLSKLAERVVPLCPELYAKEVREIYLNSNWEQRPYLVLFLREFREFFSEAEWHDLQQRYQVLFPFLGVLVAHWEDLRRDWVRFLMIALIDQQAAFKGVGYTDQIGRSP